MSAIIFIGAAQGRSSVANSSELILRPPRRQPRHPYHLYRGNNNFGRCTSGTDSSRAGIAVKERRFVTDEARVESIMSARRKPGRMGHPHAWWRMSGQRTGAIVVAEKVTLVICFQPPQRNTIRSPGEGRLHFRTAT